MNDKKAFQFGDRLRLSRLNTGLSQVEFAHKVRTTSTAISRYESGAAKPSMAVLVAIIENLDVDTNWLLGVQK